MAIATYGSLLNQQIGVTFATASGGSLTAGSAWFTAQGFNRAGLNKQQTPVQLTWTTGQKIVITIGSTARPAASDLFGILISASATNTPANFRRVCAWRGRNPYTQDTETYYGEGTNKTLPATIEITTDAQLRYTLAAITVANTSALPGSGMLHGAVRYVTSETEYSVYDSDLNAWFGGYQSDFETYISDTLNIGGCDVPLSQVTRLLQNPPPVLGDGSDSKPVVYWVQSLTGSPVLTKGYAINMQLRQNGANRSELLSDRVVARYLGLVNLSNLTIDTAGSGVDEVLSAQDEANPRLCSIALPRQLDPGYAAAYEIFTRFDIAELNFFGASERVLPGDELSLLLSPDGLLGKPSTIGEITGDVVFKDGERLRILPTLTGCERRGGRANIGGMLTPLVGVQQVTGLALNTAGQGVTLSGALGGDSRVYQDGDTIPQGRATRAIVSTQAGTCAPSAWSPEFEVSGTNIVEITLTHPTAIRSNYPDVIRGMTASFNPSKIRVFLRHVTGGNIYELPEITPNSTVQTITIDSVTGLSPTTLPTGETDPAFGLFANSGIVAEAVSGTGDLPFGMYQVAIALKYDGTDVSRISHATALGCLPEFDGDLAGFFIDLATAADFVQPAVDATVDIEVTRPASFMIGIGNTLLIATGLYKITAIVDDLLTCTCVQAGVPGETVLAGTVVKLGSGVGGAAPGGGGSGEPGTLFYKFNSELSGEPLAGYLTVNNSFFEEDINLAVVTQIRINEIDKNAVDISNVLARIAKNMMIVLVGAGGGYGYYNVSSTLENPDFRIIQVTHLSSGGTLANEEAIGVLLVPPVAGAAPAGFFATYRNTTNLSSGSYASGDLRFDSVFIAESSEIGISRNDRNNNDLGADGTPLWASLPLGCFLEFVSEADPAARFLMKVTDGTVVGSGFGSYYRFTVGESLGFASFTNGSAVRVFIHPGPPHGKTLSATSGTITPDLRAGLPATIYINLTGDVTLNAPTFTTGADVPTAWNPVFVFVGDGTARTITPNASNFAIEDPTGAIVTNFIVGASKKRVMTCHAYSNNVTQKQYFCRVSPDL